MPKCVTSDRAHFCGLAPGQHSSEEEASQRWRAVGETASDLTGPGIEPQTSVANSVVFHLHAIVLTDHFAAFLVCATLDHAHNVRR